MLTDRAARRLEGYLANVGGFCDPRDADHVIEGLREHVAGQAASRDGPIDDDAMRQILERLGEPESYRNSEAEQHSPMKRSAVRWLWAIALALPVVALPTLFIGQAQIGGLWEGLADATGEQGFLWSPSLLAIASGIALGAMVTVAGISLLFLDRDDRSILKLAISAGALSAMLLAVLALVSALLA